MKYTLPQLVVPTQLPPAKFTGLTLYSGKSQLDGKDIVVIATGLTNKSDNAKTGEMIQIYILNASVNPLEAIDTGKDKTVCGDCKHGKYGTCYVQVYQAPLNIYKTNGRGNYPQATDELIKKFFTGKNVRFGAYGDPAAVPMSVWDKILAVKAKHTAYTHQWEKAKFQDYKKFCMASCDTPAEYERARKLGWRTFRVRIESEPLIKGEFECPASAEQGKRLNCNQCTACNGTDGNMNKGTVTIVIHGTDFKTERFIAIRKRQINKKGYQDLIPDKLKNRI